MSNKYTKRSLIGIGRVSYDESGKPVNATFEPVDYKLDPEEVRKLITVPANSPADAEANMQSIFAAWFLNTEKIEMTDRETGRVETQTVSCEMWANGKPKACEVAFYFAVIEPVKRKLTGVL